MIVHLLAVDDDPVMLDLIRRAYGIEPGWRVATASTAEQAIAAIYGAMPDIVLLDWSLPDRTGFDVCLQLRRDARTAALPVIMLTGNNQSKDKVGALNAGADDYVVKPFQIKELQARVNAVLRRRVPWLMQGSRLQLKELVLEPSDYKAFVDGEDIKLTKVEFEILYVLATRAGHTVPKAFLELRVLDSEGPRHSRAVDVHVSHIREKLGPKARAYLTTERGLGYSLST